MILNKKISSFFSLLIIMLLSLIFSAVIINQSKKLSELRKPLILKLPNETASINSAQNE